jgi:hypothetical protein
MRYPKAQTGLRVGVDPLEQPRLARHQQQQPPLASSLKRSPRSVTQHDFNNEIISDFNAR